MMRRMMWWIATKRKLVSEIRRLETDNHRLREELARVQADHGEVIEHRDEELADLRGKLVHAEVERRRMAERERLAVKLHNAMVDEKKRLTKRTQDLLKQFQG